GNVFEIYGPTVRVPDNDLRDILCRMELSFELQVPLHVTDIQQTTRDIQVLTFNGIADVVEGDIVGAHFVIVHVDLKLPFRSAYDIDPIKLWQVFEAILHVVCEFLQPLLVIIAADIHVHDRLVGKADLERRGFLRQVGRQILFRLVYSVLDLLQRHVRLHIGLEFDHDGGIILLRGAGELIDLGPRDRLDLFFDRPGHEVFHVLGRVTGIDRGDIDSRDHDVGELLLGQGHELEYAPAAHDEHEQVDRSLVFYTPGGRPELFEFIGDIF